MYDKNLVADILEEMIKAINKIDKRCSRIECIDDFLDDEDGQIILDSICMLLIAIGEAVKQLVPLPLSITNFNEKSLP